MGVVLPGGCHALSPRKAYFVEFYGRAACFWLFDLYELVPAAEIRDHETGLVSGPFSWFQSRQLFLETHETEANTIL